MLTHVLAIIVGTLLVPDLVNADDLSALWIEPSLKWYGIDGNWSSIGLFVGEPAQEIDVTVSTTLSELWVVEKGGCSPSKSNYALCTSARGGVFDTSASKSWSPLGAWQLGLEYLGIGGNGDYGMETVVVYDSVRRWQTSFDKQVVGGINETGYYTGLFGLGITPGRFNDVVAQSPVASLVEQSGVIPSHSYGYTAGAYYGGERGVPLSLTLGGYDENRFEPHDVKFSLNATTRQPEVLVRSITASVSDVSKAPADWSTPSTPLLSFDQSVTALLDSSTPYLWLPQTICDRFAERLNLTWNETFGLYLFSDNDNLERYRSSPDLSFTFTLSSEDNHDNFGQPLDVTGVVNITISAGAFIQNLRYPFMNLIEYGAPAVPYFPLKRTGSGSRIIIGRSFFQEAYLITNYETSTFSVHKAKFPENPLRDTSVQTLAAYDHSPYPGPPPRTDDGGSLTQSQITGMAIGICFVGIVAIAIFFFLRWRRRKHRATDTAENNEEALKDKASTIEASPPTTPVARMVSKMSKNCPIKKVKAMRESNREERDDKETKVYEFGADHSHERYELPAPDPVELDDTMIIEVMDTSRKDGRRTSGYEFAKQQLDRQKQGLATEYMPRVVEVPAKTYHNVSPTDVSPTSQQYGTTNRTLETPSPTSSPTYDTLSNNIPSPLSSQSDWTNRAPEFYSPIGFAPAQTLSHSTSNPVLTYAPSSPTSPTSSGSHSLARAASTADFATSQHAAPLSPPPASASVQRAPIDASRVICLGPLPDNVQLPHHQSTAKPRSPSIPGILDADGREVAYPPMPPIPSTDEYHPSSSYRVSSRRVSTADTLGSNYTVEEEARLAAVREAVDTFGRIDGDDLVHIPQPALRRYSWEEQ
ncbi:acid protease [Hypoxylon sp. FL1284]|nr:acid protease [Hypoxylon sp. FL1284]